MTQPDARRTVADRAWTLVRRSVRALAPGAVIAALGCGGPVGAAEYGWALNERNAAAEGEGALVVRWTKRLTPEYEGPYVPVEKAAAALYPGRGRIYAGSTTGKLIAYDLHGRIHFEYDAHSPIEARPAIDLGEGSVYVASSDGNIHSLTWQHGDKRWVKSVGGPVRTEPVLTDDAIYVVTDDDQVVALSRDEGEQLWLYKRDAVEGFSISGHAGIVLTDGKLITGFTDGTVVALDAASGGLMWERDTSLDLEEPEGDAPQFTDVDTTPVVQGERLFAASFSGGVYALALSNGSVEWREPAKTGVIGLAIRGSRLVMSSADDGVTVINHETREGLWRHPVDRGSPTVPVLTETNLVLFGESAGSLVALSLSSGREEARIEGGNGFDAPPAVSGELGFVLTNGGRFMSFLVR